MSGNSAGFIAALVNGRPSDSIRLDDRGLQYGDGVFRTLLAYHGEVIDLPRQLAKLRQDAAQLGIPAPSDDAWQTDIARLPATALENTALKLILTRGPGQRGYRPARDSRPTRMVMVYSAAEYPPGYWLEGITLDVCETRMGHNPALAGIKHLNRLEQVLARSEPRIAIEGLMLDLDENVISGTMTNLFLASHGELLTPALERCGVHGIMRDRIRELAQSESIPVREANLRLQDCLDADECFLCNSLIGIWPVKKLAGRQWQPGPLTRRLQAQLQHPKIPVLSS